jgi:hypothetical protein
LDASGDVFGAIALVVGERMLPALERGDLDEIVAIAKQLLPDALALYARFPDDPDAYRFVLVASSVSTDEALTFRALELPVPRESHNTLAIERIESRFDAMLAWERFDGLRELFEELDQLAEVDDIGLDGARVLFTMGIVGASRGDYDWDTVEAWQHDAVEEIGLDDPVIMNAAGVALVEAGRRKLGIEVLEHARSLGHDRASVVEEAATLDLVALGALPREALDALRDSTRTDIRAYALAMLGSRPGADRAELQRLRAKQCAKVPNTRPSPPSMIVRPQGLRYTLEWRDGGLVFSVVPTSKRGHLIRAAVDPLQAFPCASKRRQ